MVHLGRYEVIEELGQGSMGTVFRAHDPIMERDVAIKRILAQTGGTEGTEFRERFFREARAAGRLAHPGIVRVFDVSEQDGVPFLVMEYIAGRTLQSILLNGERMSLEHVCDLGIQLAEALHYAHHNGVIHRDIKPANILITDDNRVKITDFGIAKLTESQLTLSGQLLGTPAFMSPEQFAGVPADKRSDLFSLGVVLYCMATGEKPFTGDTMIGVQYRVLHTNPVDPSSLNPAVSQSLNSVILKSIEKDPALRYQSGEEIADDLRAWLSNKPISATSVPRRAQSEGGTLILDSASEPILSLSPPSLGNRRLSAELVVLILFLTAFVGVTTFSLVKSLSRPPSIATSSAAGTRAQTTSEAPAVSPVVESEVVESEKDDASKLDTPIENALVPVTVSKPQNPRVTASASSEPEVTRVILPTSLPVQPIPSPLPADEPAFADSTPDPPAPVSDPGDQTYKSARLLIASVAVPEPLSIIVNLDNDLLFSRSARSAVPSGFEDADGHLRLRSVPSVPLSEERPLSPGKHKLQVSVLLDSRRVSKVQEITERFYSGQRRILEIEFLPENESARGRVPLFKIKVK
jgi:serine/threonine-protein kinase